jgi:hypothetical protein
LTQAVAVGVTDPPAENGHCRGQPLAMFFTSVEKTALGKKGFIRGKK